jgi:large conductance mechanosensitive channel
MKRKIPKPPKKVASFLTEFKAFAMRGNVIDLAVGVIIGGAFGKITSSLVNDIVMPLIGLLLGGIDLSKRDIVLPTLWETETPAIIHIGSFVQTIIDFLIIAFSVFLFIKLTSVLRKKEDAPPPPPEDVALLREIRDLLAAKQADDKSEGGQSDRDDER